MPTQASMRASAARPYGVFSLIAAFCIISYLFLDQPTALWMHQFTQMHPLFLQIAQFITSFGKGTVYFIVLPISFLLFKFVFKNKRWEQISLFLLLAMLLPSLVGIALKIILGRARPTLLFSDHIYGFTFFKLQAIYHSFPSGHSLSITGLMMGLSLVWKRYWPLFMSIALIVSLSRIAVTAHYISDVVAGMAIAIWVVLYLYAQMRPIPPA